jgi:hypothetical protein
VLEGFAVRRRKGGGEKANAYQGIKATSPTCTTGGAACARGTSSQKAGEGVELPLLLGGEGLAWLNGTHAALHVQWGCQSHGGEGGDESDVGVHFEKNLSK